MVEPVMHNQIKKDNFNQPFAIANVPKDGPRLTESQITSTCMGANREINKTVEMHINSH